jgi:hypothetical protein
VDVGDHLGRRLAIFSQVSSPNLLGPSARKIDIPGAGHLRPSADFAGGRSLGIGGHV